MSNAQRSPKGVLLEDLTWIEGVYGDPTLATREKGELLVQSLIAGILQDIEALRRSELPQRL